MAVEATGTVTNGGLDAIYNFKLTNIGLYPITYIELDFDNSSRLEDCTTTADSPLWLTFAGQQARYEGPPLEPRASMEVSFTSQCMNNCCNDCGTVTCQGTYTTRYADGTQIVDRPFLLTLTRAS